MERPILFNTEMVKAILDGRKTQSRRIIKPQPFYNGELWVCCGWGWMDCHIPIRPANNSELWNRSPAKPDDILWVRETWNGLKTGNVKGGYHTTNWYKADENDENPDDRWRPSIHMPKDAARLFLRVKDVRIERLQDMSEEDAISEGYSGVCPGAHTVYFSDGYAEPCHVGGEDCRYGYWYCNHSIQEAFGNDIWNKTIKPADISSYGWDANPWVWVIEFERTEKP